MFPKKVLNCARAPCPGRPYLQRLSGITFFFNFILKRQLFRENKQKEWGETSFCISILIVMSKNERVLYICFSYSAHTKF